MVDSGLWHQFRPGQRVLTREGVAGTVDDVQDGPGPGNERYLVTLVGGMGGGFYAASDLAPLDPTTAAVDAAGQPEDGQARLASDSYPELAAVLVDRPPPAASVPAADYHGGRVAKVAGHWVDTERSLRLEGLAASLLAEANADRWRPDYPGEPPPYAGDPLARVTAGTVEDPCGCCAGAGEHASGSECLRCDASGRAEGVSYSDPIPCAGSLPFDGSGRPTCPHDGVPVAFDPDDGWQHADGSVSHTDTDLSVSDAVRAHASVRAEGGWVRDLLKTPDKEHSYDWCRFRRESHCWYPKDLDEAATRQAGYAVWVPVDRGRCPRGSWALQEECPIGAPSPHVPGGLTDATVPWGEGGQRGGVVASLRGGGAISILDTMHSAAQPAHHIPPTTTLRPDDLIEHREGVDPDLGIAEDQYRVACPGHGFQTNWTGEWVEAMGRANAHLRDHH